MGVLNQLLKSDKKCLYKFAYNFGIKGAIGFAKYSKRKKNGKAFPAFQFISITDDCNLKCQGCWVTKNGKATRLEPEQIDHIIKEGKKQGSYFYGILGGEPLMYKGLLDIFRKHKDCYFQLFTNGTLLNDAIAKELRKCANVTPLISFEGDENVADIRRGGDSVYNRTVSAIETSVQNKLITGVAISVCKSNIDMALSDDFVNLVTNKGAIYLWYYIYRPSGENPQYELALSSEEIQRLRQFMVDGRKKYNIVIVDSYWNGDGEPFCPAAEGLSHHINPAGYIEPCPVLQIACENVKDGNISELYEKSEFLRDFRHQIQAKTKGCVLMEDPEWIKLFAEKHHALNTSNRQDLLEKLAASPTVCSHGSCKIIPEKSRMYRFAKNRAFFGLGAYG
ncbi:MAG: radical SAM protein [Salinivirgaceae bacterium]|nr:radical SAM protein [Salinivirgaceae bacterium]